MTIDISAQFETVTPSRAAEMLSTSSGNRPLKSAKINGYARDMAAGSWMPNGEPLIFDESACLIDGHHRLTACVKSGANFGTLVVYGAPVDARKTIDMGASRTSADALGFYGYANSNHLNALVRILLSLSDGRARGANPTTQEVFEFISENPRVEDAAHFAGTIKVPRIRSMLGAIYFIADRSGEAHFAVSFGEVMKTGIPSMRGCAAHALRERLYRSEISGRKLSVRDVQHLTLSAWEKFRVGVPVKTLKPSSKFKATGWE